MSSLRLHFLALLLTAPLALAVTPSSDPVGALRLRLRGNSDTTVSLPLQRPAILEAAIQSRSGTSLTLTGSVPALPAEGAYVLVLSGALEGAVLPAVSRVDQTVVIDASGYDLSALHTEAANGANQGDFIALVPYWTLDTVFPAGAGIQISASRLVAKTQILCYDETIVGTNQAAASTYFYFVGNVTYPAGWYRFGDMTALRGNTRLPPHRYFIVRHPSGVADTEVLVTGALRMAGYRLPVATLQASRDQDNFSALPVPVPITLNASGLHESGAFASSPSRFTAVDQLLVYDNTVVGQNKAASAVYFYFAGNGTYNAGWYLFGDMNQSAGTVTLKPGTGFVIRKHGTTTAETRVWHGLPTYLQ